MTARMVYWGHWLRLGLAALLGFAALVTLTLFELGAVAFLTWMLVVAVEHGRTGSVLLLLGPASGLILLLVYLLWWAVASLLGWSPGGPTGKPHPADAVGLPRLVVVLFLLPLAGFGLLRLLLGPVGLSPVLVALAVATAVVAVHQYRLWGAFRTETAVDAVAPAADREPDLPEMRGHLVARVDRLAQLADIQPPEVQIVRAEGHRVATVGYAADAVLLVSPEVIDSLDDDELDAVLAHELAHLANRDAAVLTLLALPAETASDLLIESRNPVVVLAVGPIALLCRLVVALVARHREYLADLAGARLTGQPAALASALDTLDRSGERPATDLRRVAAFDIVPPPSDSPVRSDDLARLRVGYRRLRRRLFGTHPDTGARIRRLRRLT